MEIPRDFHRQHRHELTQFISAEKDQNNIVYMKLVRGTKQVVVQFKLEEFLTPSERKINSNHECVWPWVYEIVGPISFPLVIVLQLIAEILCGV